jgi:hypothetical protein
MAKQQLTRAQRRGFVSFGEGVEEPIRYAGLDMESFEHTGVSIPQSGDVTLSYIHSLFALNQYEVVSESIGTPDNASGTLVLMESGGGIPIEYTQINCPVTVYESVGLCKELSDLNRGWSEFVLIWEQGRITTKDLGDRVATDNNDKVMTSLNVTYKGGMTPITGISIGVASVVVDNVNIIDVEYGRNVQCSNCGAANDGSGWLYYLAEAETGYFYDGYPNVLYNTSKGVGSWSNSGITVAGFQEDPVALKQFGNYLVVLSRLAGTTTGGLYYAELSEYGIPGSWNKVTTGFEAAKLPNDMWVVGNALYIAADAGVIYKCTNVTSGVTKVQDGGATTQNLTRIHGVEGVVIAGGNSGALIKSVDNGNSWSLLTTGLAANTNITAVWAITPYTFWFGTGGTGTDKGKLYYTEKAGTTFTNKSFSGDGAGSVTAIAFATPVVGWFTHNTATPTGRLFSTITRGQSWLNSTPRILDLPSSYNLNRIAIPNVAHQSIRANTVAIAGLKTSVNGAAFYGNIRTNIG